MVQHFISIEKNQNSIDVLEEILLGVKLPIDSLDENELFLSVKWLPNMLLIYIILIITSSYVEVSLVLFIRRVVRGRN